MLGKDRSGTDAELWDELKGRAAILIEKLEQGDFQAITEVIQDLNEARDRSIYREVGKLTRGLHDAIVNFEIDTSKAGIATDNGSKIANAQERLDYVINLTQSSADKTMDMVEEGIPLAASLGEQAQALRDDWQRLIRREMKPDEFRELYRRIDQFLGHTVTASSGMADKFNQILMAQDYQDLSGQVIKRVISLVQEVEERLVELKRMAGQVEEITGLVRYLETGAKPAGAKKAKKADTSGEGPQIKTAGRDDVVSGQDDVDDLLSSLGF